jgi:hypothetical protein
MSARYRYIRVTIWGELRGTSPHAKVVLWNPMTGTQSNMAGLFFLSVDTLARETELSRAEIEAALAELEKHPSPDRSLIERDGDVVCIRRQLDADPARERDPFLSNPRHRAAIISIMDSLPPSNAVVKKYRRRHRLPQQCHSNGKPIGKPIGNPIGKRMPMPFSGEGDRRRRRRAREETPRGAGSPSPAAPGGAPASATTPYEPLYGFLAAKLPDDPSREEFYRVLQNLKASTVLFNNDLAARAYHHVNGPEPRA